jgi:hypothetical protein
MPFVTPGTVVAGDVLTAARYNSDVVVNTQALYSTIRQLGFQQRTTIYDATSSTIAGANDVFSSDITFTADGTSAYRVEFYCPLGASATNVFSEVIVSLVDGSGTDLGIIAHTTQGDGTVVGRMTIHAVTYYTPAAGLTSLNIRARRASADGFLIADIGGAGNRRPMWFAVFGPSLS